MENQPNEQNGDRPSNEQNCDRPLECSECKKLIAVKYTEIIGNNITHTCMCSDCPELHKRLYGINPSQLVDNQTGTAGLECGNCGTKLIDIRRGHRLGCSECYSVFEDILVMELQKANHLAPRILPGKKNTPIHIGRAPGEKLAINASSRLLALNEALKETLSREDYEQAAFLRDQIKAITEEEQKNKQSKDIEDESSGQE